MYVNGFERLQRGILDQVVFPGSTVLDVGANLGFYTCLFAQRVGNAGRVIAVEPTPRVFQSLQENIALNNLQHRVESLRLALSDKIGVARMNIFSEGNEVYNSMGVTKTWQAEAPKESIKVDTSTMDELLRDVSDKTFCFVKIDVEGFQHQVLQGGVNRLRELENIALMVEMNDMASHQCGTSTGGSVKLLESCGFRPYVTKDGNSLTPLCNSGRASEVLNEDVFFFKATPRIACAA